jgi:hypothetical protein
MASRNSRKDLVELFVIENRFFFFIFIKAENQVHLAFRLIVIQRVGNRSTFFLLSKFYLQARAFRLSIPLKDGLRTADNKG